MPKFVLIGLPGAGKTTTLAKHVELLNQSRSTKLHDFTPLSLKSSESMPVEAWLPIYQW